MTVEEILIQLPNFLGMGIAILVMVRINGDLMKKNEYLMAVIVNKQNCSNVDASPPADSQHVPVQPQLK